MAATKTDDADKKDLGVKERFDDYQVGRSAPIVPTAVDAAGTERIVGPAIDNWKPAQVEPDPDEVARLEDVMAKEAEARQTRLGLMTDSEHLGDTAKPLIEANKAEHGGGSKSSSSRSSSSKSSSSSSKSSSGSSHSGSSSSGSSGSSSSETSGSGSSSGSAGDATGTSGASSKES